MLRAHSEPPKLLHLLTTHPSGAWGPLWYLPISNYYWAIIIFLPWRCNMSKRTLLCFMPDICYPALLYFSLQPPKTGVWPPSPATRVSYSFTFSFFFTWIAIHLLLMSITFAGLRSGKKLAAPAYESFCQEWFLTMMSRNWIIRGIKVECVFVGITFSLQDVGASF